MVKSLISNGEIEIIISWCEARKIIERLRSAEIALRKYQSEDREGGMEEGTGYADVHFKAVKQ